MGGRPGGDLVEAYFRRLHDPDPAIRLRAARDFHAWEGALFTVVGNESPLAPWLDPDVQLTCAQTVTHYAEITSGWNTGTFFMMQIASLTFLLMVRRRLEGGSPRQIDLLQKSHMTIEGDVYGLN